jgi:hypothetical protein
MKVICRFRPSGHSEDGTVIAKFKTEALARAAAEKLRQKLRIQCGRNKKTVAVYLHDENWGTFEKARELLKQLGVPNPQTYAEDIIQDLTITITVPKGISDEAMPLVVDRETTRLIGLLRAHCKCTKREGKRCTVLEFKYTGDSIYRLDRKRGIKEITINEDTVKLGPHVKVKGLY